MASWAGGFYRRPVRALIGLSCGAALLVLAHDSAPMGSTAKGAPGHKPSAGLAYFNDRVPDKPWSIHVLKVDRSHPGYELHSTLPGGRSIGLATLTEQIRSLPPGLGQPVAAINGDFWKNTKPYEGDPMGLQIAQGELVSGPDPDRACLWVDARGQLQLGVVVPQFKVLWPDGRTTAFGLNEERPSDSVVLYSSAIGPSTRTLRGRELILEQDGTNSWLPLRIGCKLSARVARVHEGGDAPIGTNQLVLSIGPAATATVPAVQPGAVLTLCTDTTPTLTGAVTALGGGPKLIHQGQPGTFKGLQTRHPRTAVGWNDHYLFFVEVDGRQRSLSVGMTLPELTDYLLKLGCREALNLDGGASSTFWILGQVMNSPSAGRLRPMCNALVLVRKPTSGNLSGSLPTARNR